MAFSKQSEEQRSFNAKNCSKIPLSLGIVMSMAFSHHLFHDILNANVPFFSHFP